MECPCCGGRLQGYDEAVRAAIFLGGKIGKILRILHRAKGRPVPADEIVAQLYAADPAGGPEYALSALYHTISQSRARLSAHGIVIERVGTGVGSKGYVLRAVGARVAA